MKKGLVIISLFLVIIVTLGLLTPINNQIDSMSYEGYNIPEREITMEFNPPSIAGVHKKYWDIAYTTSDIVEIWETSGSDTISIWQSSDTYYEVYPETLDIENYTGTYSINLNITATYNYVYKSSSYTTLRYVVTFTDADYYFIDDISYGFRSTQIEAQGVENNLELSFTIPEGAVYFVVDELFISNVAIPNPTVENLNVTSINVVGEYLEDSFLVRNPTIERIISLLPLLAVVGVVLVGFFVLRKED